MTDMKPWVSRAERLSDNSGYTYEDLARDMVDALGWTASVDVAAAVRFHVYGWSGGHALHATVKPFYDRLGWVQAALFASWFRDARNFPQKRSRARHAAAGEEA